MMDVNGENMDKRSQKEIHVHEHIIVALFLQLAQLGNRYNNYIKNSIKSIVGLKCWLFLLFNLYLDE